MISDVPITEVGPFSFYEDCVVMMNVITKDIEDSFQNHFIYGMNTDMWGQNKIIRFKDYNLHCIKK